MDYLWLIYKREKKKNREKMPLKEHTPEVSLLG
jgi:hypothetical protein